MTTAPDRIAVIATQLRRTDPRALSQAWYDALYRAKHAGTLPFSSVTASGGEQNGFARTLARAVATIATRGQDGAHTVALGRGRVRVMVRTDAGVTRLVALCAERDREAVARALAATRFALATAGFAVAA